MSEQLVTIGDHGIVLDLDERDIITDVIVLTRVMRMGDPPGSSGLVIGTSQIVQRGMLSLAQSMGEWAGDCDCEDCQ